LARYLVRQALDLEEGDTAACLRTLEEAWRTASTRSLRSSISRQYYEAMARSAAAQAMKTAEAKGWNRLAVSTFLESSSHTRAETDALREAVSRHLRASGAACDVILLEIDREQAAEVSEGRWPTELQENLARKGIDGLVLGCTDEEISLRLGEARTGQTTVLSGGRSLEAIQGRPELPIWEEIDVLIPRNEASSFSVAVWTSQKEYHTGNELEVHFRASRDCHVYLVDVQTSGGMYLLFPNSYQANAVVEGGKEYVIPGPNDEFAIQVDGPSGWEGLKIIATE